MSDKINHKVLTKSENLLSQPINEKNTSHIHELKHLRNENQYRVLIGQININLIRSKFESYVKYVGNNLHIFMVSETKIDKEINKSLFESYNF